jgi:acetyl-CoA carboxylase, biotin carboxylase subunit
VTGVVSGNHSGHFEPAADLRTATLLAEVRESVLRMVTELPTPPERIRVSAGDIAVELQWPAAGESAPQRQLPAVPPAAGPEPAGGQPAPGEGGASPATGQPSGDHQVTAATVGTFYRAPEPGAAPFTEVGDSVRPGQQLAIVEAMKLLIPVESDVSGRVRQVLRDDGQPVEFGEPLFLIERDLGGRMFEKILIANRGEIAVRVVRACRDLGIHCVVVHSTRDAGSAAARMADEAVCIGPPPPKLSYLNAAMVLQAALNTGADAIHPGYGFLSEDPEFAEACEELGVTLIGPPAAVLATLGSKDSARAAMAKAGLPLLPGSTEPLDLDGATALADQVGFPLLVKAVAGGGGRGMAVAETLAGLPEVFRQTQSAAAKLFADERVYAERYLRRARHVEVQVLADSRGRVIHLGERDCSLQRRRQKLVEESPAPALPAGLAERIRQAAVTGAQAAGYQGAGTFEFIVDDAGGFYFMEVNCRIQVEHPVTEMVTGVDLVGEQIRIAAGFPLALDQSDVELRGAAIECRINAEDPDRHFAPAPATITELALPAGPFVRVDTQVYPGCSVPPEYDPLIAKVIAWAPDRAAAIARMRRALRETTITGPGLHTTAGFLDKLIGSPVFARAEHSTSYIDELTEG